MGEVISLEQRRGSRAGTRSHGTTVSRRPACALWFDLASPSTYFAAERADRLFPGLAWRPVLAAPEHDAPLTEAGVDALHGAAAARAQELRMPLVWPEGRPVAGRAAMRVAAFAAERALADRTVVWLQELLGPLTYARVDLLAGPDGTPVILELELVEPCLYLPFAPGAAERFAAVLRAAAR